MKINLHTHTFRCRHATGTSEEYIKRAIENGIEVLGFSEHAPFLFPNSHQSLYRLPIEEAEDYFKELNELRQKYKDQIKIHIGFEMEYYPLYFNDMLATAKKLGAEYLILGQHAIYNEYPNGKYTTGQHQSTAEDLTEYVNCIISGIKTGLFTYVCHPDNIIANDDLAHYNNEMTRLCKAAKQYDIPLEINFYGIRDNRKYPDEKFWEIAGKVGAKVCFGFDSHDVASAFDAASIPVAEKLVKKYNLKLVEIPEIVNI
ncbi:MAG: histidinol-phosphatase [Clostridia bacterium]|nr:histidinol-phosphatase [Clostridia bacterium]